MSIRFPESGVRVMGRNAAGVKGIGLSQQDRVVGLVRVPAGEEANLLTVTDQGFGKRTPTEQYLVQSEDGERRPQNRGGKGRRDIATDNRNGKVVSLLRVTPGDDLMLITYNGMIVRIEADSVRQTGRGTKGVKLINLKRDDKLVAVARVADDQPDQAQQTE
jgi:DNA gyrase subunit A